MSFSRRKLLSGAACSLVACSLPKALFAFGSQSLFDMTALIYNGSWDKRRKAQSKLAWELMKRTSVEANLNGSEVSISSPELFKHPFLYMTGDSDFPAWSDADTARLRNFLLYGGFLFIDGNPGLDGGFDKAVRREMSRVFPENKLEILDKDHTLFKSFYLLDGRWGRIKHKSYVEGISLEQRTMVVYSQNDVGGAWMRDNFGNWLLPAIPGGDVQREMAFRFGINLVKYSLCTNYKSDQVHIPFIMRRRRR